MKLEEAKMIFIQGWGSLGSSWGIPKSMAQIHALLLSSDRALSTEEVMDNVRLSRGNVNINLRELINWKLVQKENVLGERKEYFRAHYDIWHIARHIVEERRRRELEPVQDILRHLKAAKLTGPKEEVHHFESLINDLHDLVNQMDQLSALFIKINDNKIFKRMLNMMS